MLLSCYANNTRLRKYRPDEPDEIIIFVRESIIIE